MRKALELAGHAASQPGGNDWWWQERLGKAYYQLGLLRDADRHFAAAGEAQVCWQHPGCDGQRQCTVPFIVVLKVCLEEHCWDSSQAAGSVASVPRRHLLICLLG